MFLAILFEYLYQFFGLEPLFTRLEVSLISVTNTYSIEQAQRDLGYLPIQNHDLSDVIRYYKVSNSSSDSNATNVVTSNKHFNMDFYNGTSFFMLISFLALLWIANSLFL